MVKSTDVYKFTLIACGYASINILKNYGEACTARSHKFCGLTFLIFFFFPVYTCGVESCRKKDKSMAITFWCQTILFIFCG